jgi:hypothetical protein
MFSKERSLTYCARIFIFGGVISSVFSAIKFSCRAIL